MNESKTGNKMRVILWRKKEFVKENQREFKVLTIPDGGDIYKNIAMGLGKRETDKMDSLWFISQQGYERIEKEEQ